MSEDEETVRAYYDACHEAHRAHGYDVERDHCPALIAEHERIEAENDLIRHFRTHVPAFPAVYVTEHREQLLALIAESPVRPPRHAAPVTD